MASQPPADPTTARNPDVETPTSAASRAPGTPSAPDDGTRTGTQLSPARPGSGGETVIFLGAGGAILAALGLLLSTEVGPFWSTASMVSASIGVLLAIIATFRGFTRGHRNPAIAAAAMTTVAVVFLVLAIIRVSTGDTATGDEGTSVDTTADNVLLPPTVEPGGTE